MKTNASILIENYELTGCHGVNPEEKTEAQRFVFSAVLDVDATVAANTDDVDKTVSYSAVCKLIKAFFGENSRNLLETLALGAARRIMLTFPSISRAEVTVRKPDAPMKGKFDSVGVRAEVRRSVAYLSMGSSVGDRAAYMDKAAELLAADELVLSVKESRRPSGWKLCTRPKACLRWLPKWRKGATACATSTGATEPSTSTFFFSETRCARRGLSYCRTPK